MFERSLSSLIKGLRSHRGKDEARYVATIMDEIKHEMRSADMDIKAEAVLKLTYLQMLGYSPSDASFHMLEVMSSPRYHLKTVGYLATSQCFSQETDVLILATNMLKKDLRSANYLDVAVALNGLAHIVTPDLAQHLAPDIIALLTHSKTVIRKKAVLVLHAMIVHHPPVLEQALPRIADKLGDKEPSVVSATVNIVCELSRHDVGMAKSFLPISPQLFELLTSSTNNWMLIKIVKLFGVLTPLEPRLARRLLSPISSIIRTTPAMSLLYECIQTVIIGGMISAGEGDDLAQMCSEKIGAFLDDEDQNLRYIALLGLIKILPSHPYLVAMHQERIFQSMEDEDLSIRLRALDLVSGMASRNNFIDIVHQQLKHLEPPSDATTSTLKPSAAQSLRHIMMSGSNAPITNDLTSSSSWMSESYRLETIGRILDVGAHDTYANIVDFEWYIDILVRLNYLAGAAFGRRICNQLIDISSRVRSVRPHTIGKMKRVLEDETFIENSKGMQDIEIVRAAAWICAEYCQDVSFPPAIITLLVRRELLDACDEKVAAVVMHNAIKLLAWWLLTIRKEWKDDLATTVKEILLEVLMALANLAKSDDVELRERTSESTLLLQMIEADFASHTSKSVGDKDSQGEPPRSLQLLSPLFFTHTLGPVAKNAQSKVVVPDGLDLDVSFIDPKKLPVPEIWVGDVVGKSKKKPKAAIASLHRGKAGEDKHKEARQIEKQEHARLRAERERRERDSPFYIGPKYRDLGEASDRERAEDVDDIPIVQLHLDAAGSKKPQTQTADSADAKATATPVQEVEENPDDDNTVSRAQPQVTVVKAGVAGGKRKKRRGRGINEEMLD